MIGFNLLEFLVDLSTKPIKTLTKAITSSRTCTLALPRPVRDRVETKTAAQVLWLDRVWKVLFVGIDKKNRITKLIFFKELVQFIASFVDPVDVIRVDDEDQTLCVVVVVSPQRPNTILTANIPDVEVEALVLNRFDIESDRRDCRHMLAKLQLVQDRCLSCSIESQHETPSITVLEIALEHVEEVPHPAK